jgi:hypothetical protein
VHGKGGEAQAVGWLAGNWKHVARVGQTEHNSERVFFQGLDLRLAAANIETFKKIN